MGTIVDQRRYARECLAMARLARDSNDKGPWLTLALSWARLAEQVARVQPNVRPETAPSARLAAEPDGDQAA